MSGPTLVPSSEKGQEKTIEVSCKLAFAGLVVILPLDFGGTKAKFIVDTGAAVTVVSDRVCESIPNLKGPKLRDPDVKYLIVAGDGRMHTKEVATFTFQADGHVFEWDMYVGPIKEDGLLGLDFLHAHDYALNWSALHLNGPSVVCELHGSPVKATRVALMDDVVIPAVSQIVVKSETTAEDFVLEYSVIDPLPSGEELRVLVGSTLVDPDQVRPVRMVNPTAEDIVLRKGTVVGYMHQVEVFTSLHPDEFSNN